MVVGDWRIQMCGGFCRGFGAIILASRTTFRGAIFDIFYEWIDASD
jgi:hypothetical protein